MTLDEAFDKLREADEPVPKRPKLPTAEEVDMAEREFGLSFHPDYRRFQLEVSNVVLGVLEPAVVVPGVMPYLSLRKMVGDARQMGVPADVLPFCQDNGDYYFIDRLGRIGIWDHNASRAIGLNKDLAGWISDDWLGSADGAG